MPLIILDGRKTRESLMPGLIERVNKLSIEPTLAIIQVGDRPDSTAFIRAKKAFAKKLGVKEKHIQLDEKISEGEVIKIIKECNADDSIQGIIVQLPLPIHIDRDNVIDAIDPDKDADGLTAMNVKRWLSGKEESVSEDAKRPHTNDTNALRYIMPATARGISILLKQYDISLSGKHVVVVGRSMLVGKPIAAMCLGEDATVTVCHSKTLDLAKETRSASVIISAVGRPGLIDAKHVREGQIVIDVGITRMADGKLTGDVDFESVKDIVGAITPVPGGVGPMTVFALFENLVDLCTWSQQDK